MRRFAAPALVAVVASAGAPAARAAEVSRDVLVEAAPGRVWQIMGPFCSIAEWHPAIARCEEESVGGEPHRRLTARDGGVFLERLVSLSTDGMSYSYEIVQSPLPVEGYRSTLAVADEGGKARVTWSSTFEPKGAAEADAAAAVAGVYESGLASIKAKVGP